MNTTLSGTAAKGAICQGFTRGESRRVLKHLDHRRPAFSPLTYQPGIRHSGRYGGIVHTLGSSSTSAHVAEHLAGACSASCDVLAQPSGPESCPVQLFGLTTESATPTLSCDLIDPRKYQVVAEGHWSDVDRCSLNGYKVSYRCVLNWSSL